MEPGALLPHGGVVTAAGIATATRAPAGAGDAAGGDAAGPVRVLIVQRILPHYRVALFQALAREESASYELAYGGHRDGTALESIADPPGLPVHPLRNVYLTVAGREVAVCQQGLRELIDARDPDVVIAEFNPRIVTNVTACLRCRRSRRKFIWWGQGAARDSWRTVVRVRVALAHAADAVLFYDERQARQFADWGVPAEKLFVAPNSIDLTGVAALASLDDDARDRVVFVGRLIREKRLPLLLHAFALARGRFGSAQRLTIIGEGPERPMLEALAASLGIAELVEFAGALYDAPRLAAQLNRAWAMASPGRIGLAVAHALAFGLPVVVARGEPHAPEVSALEDGRTAVCFPAGRADALADALVSLEADRPRRRAMARAAREVAEQRFGLSRMTAAFAAAVGHVCAR